MPSNTEPEQALLTVSCASHNDTQVWPGHFLNFTYKNIETLMAQGPQAATESALLVQTQRKKKASDVTCLSPWHSCAGDIATQKQSLGSTRSVNLPNKLRVRLISN